MSLPLGRWTNFLALLGRIRGNRRQRQAAASRRRSMVRTHAMDHLEERVVLNASPIATDDYVRIEPGQTALISTQFLTSNDVDPEGDPFHPAAHSFTTAQGVVVSFDSEGQFGYMAPEGWIGTDTFRYWVESEIQQLSNAGTVHIRVGNRAPEASDLIYDLDENTTLEVGAENGLLSQAVDADGDAISIVPYESVTWAGGYVVIQATGAFVYTPPQNWAGVDYLDVQVTDGETVGATFQAYLHVHDVVPPNGAPTPQDDSLGDVIQGQTVTGNVLQNDQDPENDALSVDGYEGAVTGGYLTLEADGDFSFTADGTFTGGGSYTYTVRDAENSATAAINWNIVTPPNVAPTLIVNAIPTEVDESPAPLEISGTVEDANSGDVITVSVAVNGSTVYSTQLTSGSSFSYSLPIDDGPAGPHSISITAADAAGLTATYSHQLTIRNVAPTAQGATINDPFPHDAPPSVQTILDAVSVSDPGADTIQKSLAGELPTGPGTHTVTVNVSDDDGATTSADVTFTIDAPPPVPNVTITSGDGEVSEGSDYALSATVEADPESPLSYTIDWGDGQSDAGTLDPGQGFPNILHTYVDDNPTATPSDVYVVTVTITDMHGQTDSHSVNVTVNNEAPTVTLNSIPSGHNEGDEVFQISGTVDDVGVNDTITVKLIIDGVERGSQSVSPGGTFSFDVHPDDDDLYGDDGPDGPTGDFAVQIIAVDDDTEEGSETGNFTIQNVAPDIVEFEEPVVISACDAETLSITWNDPGSDLWDVSWDLDADPYSEGTHTATVTVSDDDGESDNYTFDYEVVVCPTRYRLEWLEDIDEETGHRKTEVSAGEDSFGTAIPGDDFTQDADGVLANDSISVLKEIRHIGKRYMVVESFDYGDPELPEGWELGQTVDENFDEPYCEWVPDEETEPDYSLSLYEQSDDIDSVTLNDDGSFTVTLKSEDDIPDGFDGGTWFKYTLTGSVDDCGCDGQGEGGETEPEPTNVAIDKVKIDIDTDSDNDGDVDRTDEEDQVEDLASITAPRDRHGKRIFLNNDDDDRDGKIDSQDPTTAADDDDFAEIIISASNLPPEFDDAEIWIGHDPTLKLWANKQKASLTTTGAIATEHEGWYKWSGSPNFPSDLTVYAEGVGLTEAKPAKVFLRAVRTGEDFMSAKVRDTVEINVEKRVYPLLDQGQHWQKGLTSTWKGFDVADGWWMDKALVDYIMHPDVQGQLATLFVPPGTNATEDGADSFTTDVEMYGNGFVMTFDYAFDCTRGDGVWGYVFADHETKGLLDKLSFVPNSGVKFGDNKEVQVLDVSALVGRVTDGTRQGLSAFDPNNGGVIDNNGEAPFSWLDASLGEVEKVKNLVNGVVYDGAYEKMVVYNPTGNTPMAAQDFYDVLETGYGMPGGTMTIEVRPAMSSITISVNGIITYLDTAFAAGAISKLALQSHWGSGVILSNLNIQKL